MKKKKARLVMTATLVIAAAPSVITASMLTAGSEVAGSPASNLATAPVSETWRSGDTYSTSTWLVWDLGAAMPIAGGCLPNINADAGAWWRHRLADAPIAGAETVLLDFSAPAVNGPISTNVENPSGPSALLAESHTFAAAFAAPSSTPVAGMVQRFRVRATPQGPKPGRLIIGALAGLADPPSPVINGWGSGDLTTTRQGDGVIEARWDYQPWLDNPGLVGVGLSVQNAPRLDGEPADDWLILAADWQAETAASAVDSGWLDIPQIEAFGGIVSPRLADLQRDLSWLSLDAVGALAPVSHRYGRLDLVDPINPAGYVEAGRLALGPGISLELQRDFSVWLEDPSYTETSTGGNLWHFPEPPYLAARLPVETLSQGGPLDLLEALYLAQGKPANFLCSILPDDEDARALSFWAAFRNDAEQSIDYRARYRGGSRQQWSWGSVLTLRQVR